MKYRLDEPVYDSDAMQLLEVGTVVGDGCENPWRYPATAPKDLAGKLRPPNRAMTPLDAQAEAEYKRKFEEGAPDRDPTQSIPLTTDTRDAAGNPIKAPGKPNAAPNTPNEPAKTGVDVTKDDSVAKEDTLGNRTPEQHSPSTSKPAGSKS